MTELKASAHWRVTVGIATTGRRAILGQTLEYLASLQDRPDRVVVSVAAAEDINTDSLSALPFPLDVLVGPKGSSLQRNAILERETDSDIILFLDDDFLIAEGHISALRRLYAAHEDVVMSTGRVLADGVHGAGYSHAEGAELVAAGPATPAVPQPADEYSVYGCNMAIRVSTLAAHPERFDPSLPLYAWLEDMDLCRRMAHYGRIVKDDSLLGVHLGTKTGRTTGLLLGYSQIANPVYLIKKGTVRPGPVLKLMTLNIVSNTVKSLWPELWIDRRGRLRGNLIALGDIILGRSDPGRILELRQRERPLPKRLH